MTICESCIRNKDCKWNKGNPRHCTLYTDKEETNFERITESPEALAEFIVGQRKGCVYADCPNGETPCMSCKDGCDIDKLVEWLKQESDSE